MKFAKTITLGLGLLTLSGCAGGLNSVQKREYNAFQNDGVLIKEKDPTLGAVLGILPGFGSFYVREPAYGVINLLLWPVSVLWDPVSGYDGAMSINYDTTKYYLKKQKEKGISSLDDELTSGQIDSSTYMIEKRKIEEEYDY